MFKKNNRICCYNSLTMATIYMSVDEFQDIECYVKGLKENCNKKCFNEMIDENMIVRIDYNEKELLDKIKMSIFNGVRIRVMVLHMTDFCNLKCKYCFIEGGQSENYKRLKMTVDVAKTAIDKFLNIVKRENTENNNPTVVFYGGEPLLNWNVLEESLRYIEIKEQETGIHIDKVVITNGTMINLDIAYSLKEHGVMVSVSLDGNKDVHDANRIDYYNEGSFEKTINGIKMLKEVGVEPAVSCVMAKNAVHKNRETIKFLVENLRITGLGFNHVSIIPGLNYYDPQYEEQFADSIIEVQEIIQKEYPYVYERRMGHKVNTFIDKKMIKSDCTGCGEQISVSPNGQIGICQGYIGSRKTFNHSVFDQDYFPDEDPIFIEWSERSPLNIEECIKCEALATCGGGCPRNADMLHNSIWKVDTAFCHFAKKAQEWLVWQDIEE